MVVKFGKDYRNYKLLNNIVGSYSIITVEDMKELDEKIFLLKDTYPNIMVRDMQNESIRIVADFLDMNLTYNGKRRRFV